MTILRHWRAIAPLPAFAAILMLPGLAIQGGVLPFEYRLHALLLVTGLCIALSLLAGFSFAELGLGRPQLRRHWIGCVALTAGIAAIMVLQTHLFSYDRQPPAWLSFAPFYVLVSSPCQEIVCRSIPKLMTDRLRTGGWAYVLYSAAVFSMIHIAYGDAALLVNTFLLGVVWGIAYLRMQNLWPLILSHGAVGTLAFALGLA